MSYLYITRDKAKVYIENYIKNWYNDKIMHLVIGYKRSNEVYYDYVS